MDAPVRAATSAAASGRKRASDTDASVSEKKRKKKKKPTCVAPGNWSALGDDLVLLIWKRLGMKTRQRARILCKELRAFTHAFIPREAEFEGMCEEQVVTFLDVMRGHNVFITGGAGVGKSKLLTVLRKHLSPETTATTASTGCAAVLLGAGATTLHSAMGVQLGDKPASVYIKRMLKTFMPSFEADADRHLVPIRDQLHRDRVERVIKLRTLIIDEVSMISGNFLDLIGEVVRAIREFARQVPAFSKYPVGNRHDVPFGNLQLVFCGDFLQLEAVQAIQQGMAFNSKAWRALAPRVHNLTTVHRQGDGSEFAQLLQRVRIGQATEEDVQRIHFLSSTLVSRRAVYLCPLTSQVEEINNRRLGELLQRAGVPVVRLHAVEVRGAHLNRSPRYAFSNDEAHRWPHSAELQLAVGARVMCTRNVGDELVNGSTGMVKQLTATTIVVEFDGAIGGGGKPFEHTFTIPTVNNVGNRTLQESVYKHAIADPNDPTKERVARWQVPLILAWAITVHKSQGATLDRAVISFEGMFANGQAYTALSRMRALTGLTVKGLTLTKLQKVNTKTIEWYTQHK